MKSTRMKALALGLIASCAVSAQAMEVNWNGFGSVYYAQALTNEIQPYYFGTSGKHVNFTNFSLMGLNVNAKVNEDLGFAAQLVALGSPVGTTDNFGVIAQWAYANYTPMEGMSLRAGRQLFPFLLASEYVRVGYLLPMRQIPTSMGITALYSRFDGVSAYQTFNLGIGRLTAGVFGGTPPLDANSTTLAASGLTTAAADLLGTAVTLDGDGWRVRAQASRSYSTAKIAASTSASAAAIGMANSSNLDGHTQFYSAGYRFDKYNIVSWGEYAMMRTPDGTPTTTLPNSLAGASAGVYSTNGRFYANAHSYYLLGGYRIGNFLPRYTFAQGSNTYNTISTNGKVTQHIVGVNYTAGSAVIKVEFERDLIPQAQGGGRYVTQTAGSTKTSCDAFYAGVDFIF